MEHLAWRPRTMQAYRLSPVHSKIPHSVNQLQAETCFRTISHLLTFSSKVSSAQNVEEFSVRAVSLLDGCIHIQWILFKLYTEVRLQPQCLLLTNFCFARLMDTYIFEKHITCRVSSGPELLLILLPKRGYRYTSSLQQHIYLLDWFHCS